MVESFKLLLKMILIMITMTEGVQRCLPRMGIKHATFGMGCFWGPQKKFDTLAGVKGTVVGYTGGTNENPSYGSVCGNDGHIEAVRVEFDDSEITFNELLDVFWEQNEESMLNQAGQYSSCIWTSDDEQFTAAQQRLAALKENGDKRTSVTNVARESTFYIAENYHQKYWQRQNIRLPVLGAILVAELIPGLNPDIYKVAAFATTVVIILTIYERFVDTRVTKLDV